MLNPSTHQTPPVALPKIREPALADSDLNISDGQLSAASYVVEHRQTIMSENDEVEVDTPTFQVLPKDVAAEIGTIKLFNKWSYEDVEIRDISLT